MPKIFVSFTTADQRLANALVALLQAALRLANDDITFSGRRATGLRVAARFEDVLRTAVHTNDLVIAVVSPRTFQSPFQMLEIGAAWAREQPGQEAVMAIAVARRGDKQSLKDPLDRFEAAALDTTDDAVALIQWVSGRLKIEPGPAADWLGALSAVAREARLHRVRRLAERGARMLLPVVPWIVIGVITLFYLATSVRLRGQFLTADGSRPQPGCFDVDGGQRQETDDRGWADITFTSGMPGRHRIRFEPKPDDDPQKPCDPRRAVALDWVAPTPFARETQFHFDEHTRKLLVAGTTIPPILARWDATVWAAEGQSKAHREPDLYEVGVIVDAISLDELPGVLGIFRRPGRAYFVVSLDKAPIDDYELVQASPLTLPSGRNFFPVQAIPASWMPVGAGGTRKLRGFFARIPGRLVSQISSDDRLTLAGRLTLTLVGDTGTAIAEFDLAPALAKAIWSSTTLRSVAGASRLTVRPAVNVRTGFDLEWPKEITLAVGETARIPARLRRDDTGAALPAPFGIGIALNLTGSTRSGPLRPETLAAGRSTLDVALTPDGEWTGDLVSRMPRSLGGSKDDVKVVVRKLEMKKPAGR